MPEVCATIPSTGSATSKVVDAEDVYGAVSSPASTRTQETPSVGRYEGGAFVHDDTFSELHIIQPRKKPTLVVMVLHGMGDGAYILYCQFQNLIKKYGSDHDFCFSQTLFLFPQAQNYCSKSYGTAWYNEAFIDTIKADDDVKPTASLFNPFVPFDECICPSVATEPHDEPGEDIEGIKSSATSLELLLKDVCAAYELSTKEIVLAGFSQGGTLALHMAFSTLICNMGPFAGCAALHASLPTDSAVFSSMRHDVGDLPFFMCNGHKDEEVPLLDGMSTFRTLQSRRCMPHQNGEPARNGGLSSPSGAALRRQPSFNAHFEHTESQPHAVSDKEISIFIEWIEKQVLPGVQGMTPRRMRRRISWAPTEFLNEVQEFSKNSPRDTEESELSAVQLLANMLVKGVNDDSEHMADGMANIDYNEEDGDCIYESVTVDFHQSPSISPRNEHLTEDGISPTRARRGTL